MLVATRCPACGHPHAWSVGVSGPPEGNQVAHFLIPAERMWEDVVHTCRNQRIFCSPDCVEDLFQGLDRDSGRKSAASRTMLSVDLLDDRLHAMKSAIVITVHLRYIIDPAKLAEFSEYGRRWMALVEKYGGDHHGYFLPSESDSDEAFALFSFLSFADYGRYRLLSANDPECLAAYEFAERSGCIQRYERRFQRPLTMVGGESSDPFLGA